MRREGVLVQDGKIELRKKRTSMVVAERGGKLAVQTAHFVITRGEPFFNGYRSIVPRERTFSVIAEEDPRLARRRPAMLLLTTNLKNLLSYSKVTITDRKSSILACITTLSKQSHFESD
jgi:hypothetical protein